MPRGGSFVDEDENNSFEGHFFVGEQKYEFSGPTPKWGTSVADIFPWSVIPKNNHTTCKKCFVSRDGKLFESYQHMNHFNRKT